MHVLALLFCLQATTPSPAPEPALASASPLAQRRVTSVELTLRGGDAPLAGHGPAMHTDWVSDVEGWLYLWTESPGHDLCLRAEDSTGKLLLADSNHGGDGVPWIELAVHPGDRLRVHVAYETAPAAPPDELKLRLFIGRAPETEATRAMARQVLAAAATAGEQLARGEAAAARELLARTQAAIEATTGWDQSTDVVKSQIRFTRLAAESGALAVALRSAESVDRHWSALLTEEHSWLLMTRSNLGFVAMAAGQLARARDLYEPVVAAYVKRFGPAHQNTVSMRGNLAGLLSKLGDPRRARDLFQANVTALEGRLADGDPSLAHERTGLATCLDALGQRAEARALLERVCAALEAAGAKDDDLRTARFNLANHLRRDGELQRALEMQERILEQDLQRYPAEHPEVQASRLNLASTYRELGQSDRAEVLQRQAVEGYLSQVDPDHPDLQTARLNLAGTLAERGAFDEARALQEAALAVREKQLAPDDPELQLARSGLAITLKELGDVSAAAALEQQVVEALENSLPPEDEQLVTARYNLAKTIWLQGDLPRAREMMEAGLEEVLRTKGPDSNDVLISRLSLAGLLIAQDELGPARELLEAAIEAGQKTLPPDHVTLLQARGNLAAVLARTDQNELAAAQYREVLAGFAGRSEPDQRDLLSARLNLCTILIGLRARNELVSELRALQGSLVEGLLAQARVLAPRAIDEYAAQRVEIVEQWLSMAGGEGLFPPFAEFQGRDFELVETLRGAGMLSARLLRISAADPAARELAERVRALARDVARLDQRGAPAAQVVAAVQAKEAAERELLERLEQGRAGGSLKAAVRAPTVAAGLAGDEAAISFWRFARNLRSEATPFLVTREERFLAFVVRSKGSCTRVELGSAAAIESAVDDWLAAVHGAGRGPVRGAPVAPAPTLSAAEAATRERAAGERLRALVFDPLQPHLEGARALTLVPDDVLHQVAFDALPLAGPAEAPPTLLGERCSVRVRTSLWELAGHAPSRTQLSSFVGFGGIDFDAPGEAPGAASVATPGATPAAAPAAAPGAPPAPVLAQASRAPAQPGVFPALPGTRAELEAVADLWRSERRGPFDLRADRAACASELVRLAPRARVLHIATHGFAEAPANADASRRLTPLAGCGLALAGANVAPANGSGGERGVLTAEELATLDLSGCELAVLSACQTTAGTLRPGLVVASLRKALEMAGARSVVSSLWNVPDQATQELMVAYYQRLWSDGKSKATALWEAKQTLRERRDAAGRPLYATRDWAAWVLSGDAR